MVGIALVLPFLFLTEWRTFSVCGTQSAWREPLPMYKPCNQGNWPTLWPLGCICGSSQWHDWIDSPTDSTIVKVVIVAQAAHLKMFWSP